MRHDAFLYIFYPSSEGKNEYGESLGATGAWGEAIPCHIRTLSDNRLGRYEDGTFHQASYNVLTLPLAAPLPADGIRRVRLVRRGEELGEYEVQSMETIATQHRLQIVV